jgi:hypothetical protein
MTAEGHMLQLVVILFALAAIASEPAKVPTTIRN